MKKFVRFSRCARRWEPFSPRERDFVRGQVHLGSAFRPCRGRATTALAICPRPLYG